MFSLWLNLLRIALLAGIGGTIASAYGKIAPAVWAENKMTLLLTGIVLGLIWIVAEFLARNAPPDDLEVRLRSLNDGRALPTSATKAPPVAPPPREVEPDRDAFILRVQKLAASEQFAQLAKELPRPAILEPLLQQIPAAERPRILVALAQAHEAAKDYDSALMRAGHARALKPDSQLAREIICRSAVAIPPEKFRTDDYYPAFKELAINWKEEYAPLVLYALRAGMGQAKTTPRGVAQIWDLLQPFRKLEEVVDPFLAELTAFVANVPERADLLAVVARARALTGNTAAALKVASEATSYTLDCPSVYKFLLEHHQSAGKLGELAMLLQNLSAGGATRPALENARRDCDRAITAAADAASRKAEASATPLEMGLGHLSKGDYPKAITFLQKAIQKAPPEQTSFIRFLLARSFLKGGQAGPALEHLDRTDSEVLTLDQRYDLATDLEACGQLQQARKLYASIAAVNQAHKDVSACLARLDAKLSKDPQQLFEEGITAALPKRFTSPRLAGQGGMGVVYRAYDTETERPVAIKVLSPMLASDGEHKRRFLREAGTLALLDHPGVVRILDVGEKPLPYYSMEYLAGTTLGAHMKSVGPMDPASVATLGARIAESLGYCHEQGLIHRDIKPDNIFLEENGRVVLIDFGLVHVDAQTAITRTGAVMGTLSYMAPEQLTAAPITAATDIYALGVTLYEMVTGRVPFEGGDVIGQVMMAVPPTPKSLVPGLTDTMNATIMKCIEKTPKRRFETCAQLAAALAAG